MIYSVRNIIIMMGETVLKHYFVINPFAGKGNRPEKLIEEIKTVCDNRDVDYTLHITSEVGDAERYIRKICEQHGENTEPVRFYACGGDGTINECVNGAVGFSCAEVAAVPIGTGNDFVRNFGTAEDFFDIGALLDAHAVPCDLIKYNDRYCVNMINIGYDCAVVVRTAKIKKNPLVPGKLAYIFGLVGELIKKTGVSFRCIADGCDLGDHKLLLSLFANGGYCGGGFYTAPRAELCDGLMDLCFVRYIPRIRFVTLVGKYKKGTHLDIKNHESVFAYRKCREVELSFSAPQQICVDGEIEICDALHMTVVPAAIRFVVPEKKESAR